jgi:hypothetical protein
VERIECYTNPPKPEKERKRKEKVEGIKEKLYVHGR